MNRTATLAALIALIGGLLSPALVAAVVPYVVDDPDFVVAEDSGTTKLAVLANDTSDGTPDLAIAIVSPPSGGSAVAEGLFVDYTPDPNYHGPDSFTYAAHNADGTSADTARVDILVAAIDDGAPVAVDDTAATNEDASKLIDVTANDSDPDGDGLTIVFAGEGSHGATTIMAAPGKVRYTPDPDYNGPDSFSYTVRDGDGQTSGATVMVTVGAVEDGPPVARSDDHTVDTEDGPTTIDVLANDDDPDPEETLTIVAKTNGTKGTVAIAPDQRSLTYDPASNQAGPDTFTYTVSDGHGGTDVGNVDVNITNANDPPLADDDDAVVAEGGSVDIDVLDNDSDPDGDPLAINTPSDPPHGTATIVDGKIRYVPAPDFHGSDAFTYTARDGHGGTSNVATVDVTVTNVNDDPVAIDDAATTDEDEAADVSVRSNDIDIDGDTLSITGVSDPPNGSVTIASGRVRYVPDADYHGADTFTYDVSDGHGGTSGATVTMTVRSVNDAPVADDDTFTVDEDSTANPLLVLAGDGDIDGDAIRIKSKTNGAHGTVAIDAGGPGLKYTPNHDYSGLDTFTYVITDGLLDSSAATVTVDVGGDNDAPVPAPDAFDVGQGASATPLDVLDNDADPDGDQLIIAAKTNGAHGTVTITGNGTGLTYNPAGTYTGADLFTYQVTDGSSAPIKAKVFVTVVPDTLDPVVVAPTQRFIGQTVGTSTTKVRISWSATDAGVGVASYKLQVSTNGGSYKTVTLPKKTSTSIDRALSTGKQYRFRVRATDKVGNVSSYRYGPTVTPKRYSQDNTRVTYVGAWKATSSSNLLGGTARHATSTTKSATFAFTGYDVGWIATRTTSSGKAQVLIDGAPVTIVDLDVSSTAFRKLVFQRHFPVLGAHTLTITPIGDGRVDIDGFVILK